MSYTAPSVRKLDVGVGTDHQVLCSEFAKIATELGNDQALASGKIIVGNASGVATDVTMSGDATLSNAGALTIAAEAVTLAKMADLARGSLISGQTADNRPTALDAKGSGKILVGDGTDVNSVSVSGDVTLATTGAVTIASEAVTVAKMADLARGSIITGQTDDRPLALDAKTSGQILVGSGTDIVSVAVSGDATLASTGALTIAAEAVTVAKMADLARGSILTGQTADNRPIALDAKTSGRILVGDGTDLVSVAVSGDVTLAANGAVTIAAGAVDEAMLSGYGVDGLHTKRIARATYDFAVDGGTVGDIGLGVTLPDNAIITRSWYSVLAGLTSADSTAEVSLSIPTDDVAGIAAATAISTTNWDAGNHEGIQDGAAANFSVQTTAARELTLTIGVQALTAGKLILFCDYVVLE